MQLLIGAGVRLEASDGLGSAALHLAALGGKLETFQALLAGGAPYVRSRVLHLSPLDCVLQDPKAAAVQAALVDAIRARFNGSSSLRGRLTGASSVAAPSPSRRSRVSALSLFDRPNARQGTWRGL